VRSRSTAGRSRDAGEKYLAAHEKITVRLGTVRMDVRASASIGSFRENASPSLYDIFWSQAGGL